MINRSVHHEPKVANALVTMLVRAEIDRAPPGPGEALPTAR
jgi:hypothetical protein